MTAAPMKPAAPMGYPCADAALLVLVDAAVEVDEPELLEDRVVVLLDDISSAHRCSESRRTLV
jgi:hypothetical protein